MLKNEIVKITEKIGKLSENLDKNKKKIDELKGDLKQLAQNQTAIMKEAQAMLKKWEQGDEKVVALWKEMNGWVYKGFEETYKAIGVDFNKFYYESDTYLLGKAIVEEGLQKGIFYKKEDNSVWIDLTSEGLDHKLVLRGDGTSVYITQDLGTADLKYKDFQLDKSVYVIGNEQDYHLKVLFAILKKLGRPYAQGLYHLSYGMVELPTGRMKSREGTVVDADNLLTEMKEIAKQRTIEAGKIEELTPQEAEETFKILASGALKYFLLKVDPVKRIVFNPDESVEFQGDTGVFIQYTYVRTAAILRKAQQLQITHYDFATYTTLHQTEKAILQHLDKYPQKVWEAGENYAPSVLAQYVYELAKLYNSFYGDLRIFNAESKVAEHFRIALTKAVGIIIKKALGLLGIQTPERM